MKKNLFYILILSCILFCSPILSSKASSTTEDWKAELFMLEPKGIMHSEVIGKNVYLIGGSKGSGPIKSVDIFNSVTKTWGKGQNMPNALYSRAHTVYMDKIYLFGGTNSTKNPYATVDIYNPVSDTWSVGKSMPYAVKYASAISVNNLIYVFGGSTVNSKCYIQIYDPLNNSWTTKSMPFIRYELTIKYYEGKVYMFGGYDGKIYHDEVNIYNPVTEEWTKGKNMPTKRSVATSVIHGSKVYVIGGRNFMSDNKTDQSVNAVEIYDIIENNWIQGKNMSLGRRWASSALLDGRIYVFGGRNPETVGDLDSVISLKIEEETVPENEELQVLLYTGEEVQLSISFDLEDNKNLNWTSSLTQVANVDMNGRVTALEEGITEINVSNKTNTYMECISVRVIKGGPDPRLAIHLKVGQSLRLYMKEDPLAVSWLSMDPTAATISSTGQVTGISKGLVIMKAVVNNNEKLIYVRVN